MAVLAPVIGLGGPIGEPAAPLEVKEWIKGKPVEVKAGTNVFVVEVFTTGSLASRAIITNLNELQRRYRDQGVVVVGISDEPPERLKEFISQAGAAIEYAIAADNGRKTTLNYMMPVGKRGVPYSFVVGKDGKLLWHGHPHEGLSEAMEQIITGRYNVEQAGKIEIDQKKLGQYVDMTRRRDPRAAVAGRELLSIWTNDVIRLCDLAREIATDRRIAKRDFLLANDALDRAEQLGATNSTRVAVTRAVVLFESGKKEQGRTRAQQALAAATDPKDKEYVESYLKTMEARLATAQTNAAGQKDPVKARIEQYAKAYFPLARRNDPTAAVVGRELMGMLTNDLVQLCDLAIGIATDRRITNRDLVLAEQALAQAQKVAPTNYSTRVEVTRAVLLFETGGQPEEALARAKAALAATQDPREKAYAENCLSTMQTRLETVAQRQKRAYAKEYLSLARRNDPQAPTIGRHLLGMLTNDPVQLCNVALGIATDDGITNRDLVLADQALGLASRVAPTNSSHVAATQAVLLFERGKKQDGIDRAREAVAAARDEKEQLYAEACLKMLETRLKQAGTNAPKGSVVKP